MKQSALLALALGASLLVGCATAPGPVPSPQGKRPDRGAVVQTALGMVGTPYRYGGSSPKGFDCSGLVIYSYARAGRRGLPHSARELERIARPISLAELEPGDLLFFDLSGKKTAHVGIYVGDQAFVHAPSGGKHVEVVGFDHVYWGERLGRAGRLLR